MKDGLKTTTKVAKQSFRAQLSQSGEELAAQHLSQKGFRILERNWRYGRFGELDIIAQDPDGTLIFAEVKTRRTLSESADRLQLGFQAVDGLKQHKVLRMAQRYLVSLGTAAPACRFDVIVVHFGYLKWNAPPREPDIIHVKDAFHHLSWS
jgi:putative endonuclease